MLKNTLRRFDHTAQGLGARWELMSEEAFRNGLVAIFTDELGFRVKKYEDYDDSGSIFRPPEQNVTVNQKCFISPFVDSNAVGLAAEIGIELYTHSLDTII